MQLDSASSLTLQALAVAAYSVVGAVAGASRGLLHAVLRPRHLSNEYSTPRTSLRNILLAGDDWHLCNQLARTLAGVLDSQNEVYGAHPAADFYVCDVSTDTASATCCLWHLGNGRQSVDVLGRAFFELVDAALIVMTSEDDSSQETLHETWSFWSSLLRRGSDDQEPMMHLNKGGSKPIVACVRRVGGSSTNNPATDLQVADGQLYVHENVDEVESVKAAFRAAVKLSLGLP